MQAQIGGSKILKIIWVNNIEIFKKIKNVIGDHQLHFTLELSVKFTGNDLMKFVSSRES